MIRKSILSILGGVVFAAVVAFAVTAKAGCYGLCADTIGNYQYAGCTITLYDDGTGHVDCFYTEGGPGGGDPHIAD